MKRTIFLLLILLLVGITSCKDEDAPVADASDFKAVMNDESWTSNTSWANYSQTEHTFYVNATRHDPRFYRDEQLTISFEMTDLSKPTTITQFTSQWYSIIGGKDSASRFYLDSSASNEITITAVIPEKKLIEGTFKIHMVRASHHDEGGEISRVIEGRFSMEYNEIE